MMPNVVLIGFMGTGKTTVGKGVSKKLEMEFVDIDQEVEKITGLTVREIFQRYGETRFRSEETAAVKRLAKLDNLVISTGGGVVLKQENIDFLNEKGIVISLWADPDTIYNRVSRKKTRPLLMQENPRKAIEDLLKQREHLYKQARFNIDTSHLTLEQVIEQVIEIYHKEVASNGNAKS